LKLILKKEDGRLWAGVIWLRIGTSDGVFKTLLGLRHISEFFM
jgi:hypothetical protein